MTTYTAKTDRIILGAGTDSERRIPLGGQVTEDELVADGCQVQVLVAAGLVEVAKAAPKAAKVADDK